MLQVKNYSRWLAIFLTVVTISLVGCKDKNKPDGGGSFVGNKSKPAWVAPEVIDPNSSMTVVAKVDLTKNYVEAAKKAGWQIADEDILAAFIGNTCLGAVNPKDGLFYLFIAAPETNGEASISLRYYSAKASNYFVAKNVLTYQNDGRVGTPSEPFEPQFVVEQ